MFRYKHIVIIRSIHDRQYKLEVINDHCSDFASASVHQSQHYFAHALALSLTVTYPAYAYYIVTFCSALVSALRKKHVHFLGADKGVQHGKRLRWFHCATSF